MTDVLKGTVVEVNGDIQLVTTDGEFHSLTTDKGDYSHLAIGTQLLFALERVNEAESNWTFGNQNDLADEITTIQSQINDLRTVADQLQQIIKDGWMILSSESGENELTLIKVVQSPVRNEAAVTA